MAYCVVPHMSRYTTDDKADIQRERWLAEMREKRKLSLYGDLEHSWGREASATYSTMIKKKWRSMVPARNLENKGESLVPPMRGEESEFHLLLKCPETQRWREELLKSKRPQINEELAVMKTLSKMPLNREAWAPSHIILDANEKIRLRKQN